MTDAGAVTAGTLLQRVYHGVAWITLNRPDAGNAGLHRGRRLLRGAPDPALPGVVTEVQPERRSHA